MTHNIQTFPLFVSKISAGFPSPAEDYVERKLDLHELLIQHPAATFFVKVEGNSMIGAGIQNDDILIVDRALSATDKSIIVAVLNGEFLVKRIRKINRKIYLVPENASFKPYLIKSTDQFEVWGVVSTVIHRFKV